MRPHRPEPSDKAATAETMLTEARSEVAQADQKASMLLAALGIGFGLVLSGQLAGDWSPENLSTTGEWAWWVGATCAATSVAVAAAAIWPRFHADDVRNGIAYWGHVAAYSSIEEFDAAFDGEAMGVHERTRHQLWHLSRVVARKYALIRWAMVLAAGAIVTIGTGALALR